MNHLQDLHVLVLGLGASGLAMARWCARFGAHVQVWDSREQPPQAARLLEDVPDARLRTGAGVLSDVDAALNGVQLVLKSPGLAPGDERIAPLLAQARRTGVPVQGELELFARALADLAEEREYRPKVIAITGTNGKSTTTSLTAQLIERAGRRVAMAGNIGPTMLDTLGAALDLEPVIVSDFGKLDELPPELPPCPAPSDANASEDEETDDEATSQVLDEHGVVEQAMAAGAQPPDAQEAPAADEAVRDEPASDPHLAGQTAQEIESGTDAAPHESIVNAEAGEAAAEMPADSAETSVPAGPLAGLDEDELVTGERPLPIPLPPPPPPVFEHLPEVWVLELSSFQLDDTTSFAPSAAAVLNITQDHLDWHGSMNAYAAAKARIFGPVETSGTVMVVNRDDARVMALLELPAPPVPEGKVPGAARIAKAHAKLAARHAARQVVRFGLEPPTHPGDFGVITQNGMAWLVRAMEADPTEKRRGKVAVEDLSIQRLMPADALRVRGRHNWANALAALALATAVGTPLAPMLHGLREYAGEPHRVQFLASVNGVEAFDDSKGTNVGATVAAITGLGADRAPARLVLILGGDGKGQDFTPLAAPMLRHARAAALIGRDAEAIERVLQEASRGDLPMARHETLEAATRWAFAQARRGDAVLLSPACASLDMFRDYAHRAEVFAAEVQVLAQDTGEVL